MCKSSMPLQTVVVSIRITASLRSVGYQRNDLGGVLSELVGKLFVVGDEVGNVDVAVVLLHQDIFTDLVSVEL